MDKDKYAGNNQYVHGNADEDRNADRDIYNDANKDSYQLSDTCAFGNNNSYGVFGTT